MALLTRHPSWWSFGVRSARAVDQASRAGRPAPPASSTATDVGGRPSPGAGRRAVRLVEETPWRWRIDRTGAMRVPGVVFSSAALLPELAEDRALEARLERVALGATGGTDREALLGEMRRLIEAESARQQQSWRANLAQLEERAEARRRYDLARVSAGLSYLDGRTGEQVARTTELINYVLQASQEK